MEVAENVVRQILDECTTVFTTNIPIESGMEAIIHKVQSNPPFSNVSFPKPEEPFLLVEAVAAGWLYRQDGIDALRGECAKYLVDRYREGWFSREPDLNFNISAVIQRWQNKYGCSLNIEQITDKIFQVLTDISKSRKLLQRQYEQWISTLKTSFEVKTIPQLIEEVADEICLIEALKQDNAIAIVEFQRRMLPKAEAQARIFNDFWTIHIPLNRSDRNYHLDMDVDEMYTWMIIEHPPCEAFHNPTKFDATKSSLDYWIGIIIMDRWVRNKKTGRRRRQPGLLFEVLKAPDIHGIINYDKVEHRECLNPVPVESGNTEECMAKYEGEKCYKCHAYFDENRDKRVLKGKYFNPRAYRKEFRKECNQCGNLIVLTGRSESERPQCPRDSSPPKEYAKPIRVYVYDRFLHLASSAGISLDAPVEEYKPPLAAFVPDRDEEVGELFEEIFEEASSDETIIEVLREEYPEDEREAKRWKDVEEEEEKGLEEEEEREEIDEDVKMEASVSQWIPDIDLSWELDIRPAKTLLQKFDSLLDGLPLAIWRYVHYAELDPMNQRRLDVLWELDVQQPLEPGELIDDFLWIIEEQRRFIENYPKKRRTSPLSFPDLAEQFRNNKVKIEKSLGIILDQALTADNIGITYRRNIVERLEEVKNVTFNFPKLWDYVSFQLDDYEKLVWNYVMAEQENPNNRDWSIVLQAPLENLLDAKQSEKARELLEESLLSLYVWVRWQNRRWQEETRPRRWTTLAGDFNKNNNKKKIQEKLDILIEGDITANCLENAFKKMTDFFDLISK
jgi:hypothetical protein